MYFVEFSSISRIQSEVKVEKYKRPQKIKRREKPIEDTLTSRGEAEI